MKTSKPRTAVISHIENTVSNTANNCQITSQFAISRRPCIRPARPTGGHHAREPGRCRDTRFKAGNTAWQTRRSPGRRRRFADAAALYAECCGYFEWSDPNPLIHIEPVVYRGKLTMLLEVPRLRPYSIAGMCVHLKIGTQTWRDYRRRPDFSWVCERVESEIWAQQFEGVAAGLFDPRIIARSLSRPSIQ
jgi:hypothetical protein